MEKPMRKVCFETQVMVDNPVYSDNPETPRYVPHPFIEKAQVGTRQKQIYKPIKGEGCFHQWGMEAVSEDGGCGTNIIGLVEAPDGQMFEVYPKNLKFIS